MDLTELSPSSYQVFNAAAEEMYKLKSGYFGVEHLFLGLLHFGGPEIEASCARVQLDQNRFSNTLRSLLQADLSIAPEGEPVFTPRVTRVQAAAGLFAAQAGSGTVEPVHLFRACLEERRSVPSRILNALQAEETPSSAELLEETLRVIRGEIPASEEGLPVGGGSNSILAGALGQFGRDLTTAAASGDLDPVVGRDAVVLEAAGILARRQKSNAMLVGDAGVGKTAVAHGFAQFLVQKNVPATLRGLRLLEVSIPALVAGTQMRGELEERLQAVFDEAKSAGNIILFFDNFHQMTSGNELGEMLNSFAASGDHRMIGAISSEAWEKIQSGESGLGRRFEPVKVEELSEEQTLAVLRSLQPSFEEFHSMTLGEEALNAAIHLSVRYVQDRRLPDKAIDAIDQACASSLLEGLASGNAVDLAGTILGEPEIARTISRWTGIPLERVGVDEAERLLHLEDSIQSRVIGQDEAVSIASAAVRAGRAGVSDPNRPLAVLLFTGPTGVGKTELAKALAAEVFGSEDHLVRLDMTEYTEAHSVARLTGAPPGYVGHGDDGVLVSAVRKSPYTVILFDEIEKAHSDVFDVLLPVFDEGRLRSSTGRVADMRNSLIILTSNLLQQTKAEDPSPIGFETGSEKSTKVEVANPLDEGQLREILCQGLRPEFVNRLDAIVPFSLLGEEQLKLILDRRLDKLRARAKEQGVELQVEESAFELLLREGTDMRFGARPLERAMDRYLRRPLAEALLRRSGEGGVLRAVEVKGKIELH